jgi:ATP-dependent Clp protease ATP-binding subunit ClpA
MKYFNKESKNILKIASDTAKLDRKKFLTVQQFYLCSLKNPQIESLFSQIGIDVKKLKQKINSDIDNAIENSKSKGEDLDDIAFSPILQKFLKETYNYYTRKLMIIKQNKLNEGLALIEPYDLILCLFAIQRDDQQEKTPLIFLQNSIFECSEQENYTQFVIDINNFCSNKLKEKYNLETYSLNKLVQSLENENIDSNPNMHEENMYEENMEDVNISIKNYADNLNELYKIGKLDREIIGRDKEIKDIEKILSRKKKNNPILVGDSGVGKNAVAYKIVENIVKGNVPDTLKGANVWSLNISKLISGTKYRGDFEKRMNIIIEELKKDSNNILMIDNIHQVLSANSGSSAQQGLDVAGLLLPALSEGYFKCLGIITYDEYNKVFLKDKTFPTRFQKVIINETSNENTLKILDKIKFSYEKHHNVSYPRDILEEIVLLSERYLHSRKFPDKAIDLLDEAGALYSSKQKKGNTVKREDVYEVISQQANIKLNNEKAMLNKLKNLNKTLKERVHGQDKAVDILTQAVYTAKAGLSNPKKPYGSFLFLGPTGVGKTEITQSLADELGLKLHRFDMSEYMESHTVSKLIGAPPGYVGYEESGQLTEAVDKDPYSIVLLDEVEKANPKIFNTLLQVLDNGFLTDGKGKHVSFRNTIIIMTSNAGAKDLEKKTMGFKSKSNEQQAKVDINVLKDIFSPEFRNRLSAIVTFDYLEEQTVLKIVNKFTSQLQEQLKEKDVNLELTIAARKWLMHHGYDKNMGARPMERTINEFIKTPLSYEILFGKLSKGGTVKVTKKNNNLDFEYKK